jgi:hypothetical protein
MDRPFLAFHIHSGHVPGHLHLLGGKYLRGSEQSRSQHCRILKKSSSCTVHARLLEFSMLQTAIFADKSLGLVRHSFRVHAILLGKQTSSRVARPSCSQFFGRNSSDSKDTRGYSRRTTQEVVRPAKMEIRKRRPCCGLLQINGKEFASVLAQA